MATPNPRSYIEILSEMLATFQARAKIKTLKIGNPILTILEAAAQSDARNVQDYFTFLESVSIDYASPEALERIAISEGTRRLNARNASGFVTFKDGSITKKSTFVYQTNASPGSGSLNVVDASLFPSSGKIYVGRGTANYEGPISYSGITNNGTYYTFNLLTTLVNFHDSTETVILAQNGDRLIPSGTIVETSAGLNSIKFYTTASVIMEDGEDTFANVEIFCQTPGSKGNVAANSINKVTGNVFPSIQVTNPSVLSNGSDVETIPSLRERLKKFKQARVKGTANALEQYSLGVTGPDNKTVVSSKVYDLNNAATLYIDDGNGYEETYAGASNEVLVRSALGGEQYFNLANRPVAPAFLRSVFAAPFNLKGNPFLTVSVNQQSYTHSFLDSDFKNPLEATAAEVADSINRNSSLGFLAKISSNRIYIFGKNYENELKCENPIGFNANDVLGFPVFTIFPIRLFKNKALLYQDGREAVVYSEDKLNWDSINPASCTIILEIDQTQQQTYTFTDLDFINANTGYTSVSHLNSLDAWAKVFNYKIPGITATVTNNRLKIVSNKGVVDGAQISIIGGTLTPKIFAVQESIAQSSDYDFNENFSQIKLAVPLAQGDELIISNPDTRSYIESLPLADSVVLATDFSMFLFVDGQTEKLATATSTNLLNLTNPATGIALYTTADASTPFIGLKEGDWVLATGQTFSPIDTYLMRVSATSFTGNTLSTNRTTITPGSGTFTDMVAIRSTVPPQLIVIPSGTYSPVDIAAYINNNYPNVEASITSTQALKISTKTLNIDGEIYLAGTLGSGIVFGEQEVVKNQYPEVAAIESSNSELGTPFMSSRSVKSGTFATQRLLPANYSAGFDQFINYRITDIFSAKQIPDTLADAYVGPADGTTWPILAVDESTAQFTADNSPAMVPADRPIGTTVFSNSPFTFSANDTLSLSINKGGESELNYSVPFYRELKPTSSVYSTNLFSVTESPSGDSLYDTFGNIPSDFFTNFACLMKARGKSHSLTSNKTILYRNGDFGPQGEGVKIRFTNPMAANSAMKLTQSFDSGFLTHDINLASGAALTPSLLLPDHTFAETIRHTHFIKAGDIKRTPITVPGEKVTVTCGPAGVNCHSIKVGDFVYKNGDEADFPAGLKLVTEVTANTFVYLELGAITTSSNPCTFTPEPLPCGTIIGSITTADYDAFSKELLVVVSSSHNLKVGDIVAFTPGYYDPSGAVIKAGYYKVVGVPSSTEIALYIPDTTLPTGGLPISSLPYWKISEGAFLRKQRIFTNLYSATGNTTRNGSGYVTVLLDSNNLYNKHNYQIGDVAYVQGGGGVVFANGYKTLTAVTASSLTFFEGGGAAISTAPTTVSFNSLSNPSFSGIPIGTVLTDTRLNGEPTSRNLFDVTTTTLEMRIDIAEQYSATSYSSNELLKVSNRDFTFIPKTAISAANVVSWVNTNAKDATGKELFSAVLVPSNTTSSNDGSALITEATEDEFFKSATNSSFGGTNARSSKAFGLFDGYQSILANNVSLSSSQIQFKTRPFNLELLDKNDFQNEILRIVPTTAENVSNILNSKAYSGFAQSASASISNFNKVQVSNKYAGEDFNLQVNGGSANLAVAFSTNGSTAIKDSTGRVIGFSMDFKTSDLTGFTGNAWVRIENPIMAPKYLYPSGTVTLSNIGTGKTLALFSSPPVSTTEILIPMPNEIFRFENHKGVFSVQDQSPVINRNYLASLGDKLNIGDIFYISFVNANEANRGSYRIVGIDYKSSTFFLSGSCIPETIYTDGAVDNLTFVKHSKLIEGDLITIKNNAWGSSNNGTVKVASFVLDPANLVETSQVILEGNLAPGTYVCSYPDVSISEGVPSQTIAYVSGIRNNGDGTTTVTFSNNSLCGFTEDLGSLPYRFVAGAKIEMLDKLGFDTTVVSGINGYAYNTGLLAEVNRVIFGDERNPILYPGVAATGTNLSLSGPIIKRIKVSLAIRSSQTNQNDLISKVKSAVTTVINSTPIGNSIALSDLIEAANRVSGVESVVMLSPQLLSSSDTIPTQPFEKARVLDIENDISVSVLG